MTGTGRPSAGVAAWGGAIAVAAVFALPGGAYAQDVCLENGRPTLISVGEPLPTCTGSHLVDLTRMTDSGYVAVDGQDRQNIRPGASADFAAAGCRVIFHKVEDYQSGQALISVNCR